MEEEQLNNPPPTAGELPEGTMYVVPAERFDRHEAVSSGLLCASTFLLEMLLLKQVITPEEAIRHIDANSSTISPNIPRAHHMAMAGVLETLKMTAVRFRNQQVHTRAPDGPQMQ